MSAANALVEGQTLVVPAGVMRSGHNSSTFRPYDASDAVGDASPTNPKMPKKNKCAMVGQIMLVAVAVGVSTLLTPAISGLIGSQILGGALAGAAGSIASQGVGIATGLQDQFSFKQVAMAGISAGIGAGIGEATNGVTVAGSKFVTDVVRGAAGSAISQGIGVATGLQSKFDFAGVAAAGLGAGVGGAIRRGLSSKFDTQGNPVKPSTWNTADGFGQNAAVATADAVAEAATRSVIAGTSFGDNLLAALPSAIGNTIGGMVGRAIDKGLANRLEESRKSADGVKAPETGPDISAKPAVGGPAANATIHLMGHPALLLGGGIDLGPVLDEWQVSTGGQSGLSPTDALRQRARNFTLSSDTTELLRVESEQEATRIVVIGQRRKAEPQRPVRPQPSPTPPASPRSGRIDTRIPASGTGYRVYGERQFQYGTPTMIQRLQRIGEAWSRRGATPIQFGRISRHGGGNLPPHASHKTGVDVDVRPFRSDGQPLPVTWRDAGYDRAQTLSFIRMVRQMHPGVIILFNDPVAVRQGLSRSWRGHDNHLHISFRRVGG
jgi:hypothetical protein